MIKQYVMQQIRWMRWWRWIMLELSRQSSSRQIEESISILNFFPPKSRGDDSPYVRRRPLHPRFASCCLLHLLCFARIAVCCIISSLALDSIHLHQPALPIDHPTASVRNSSSINIHVRQPPPSAVDSSFAYTISTSINNNF
jgi:hypothetical protein